MAITPEQARAELARRELARRDAMRSKTTAEKPESVPSDPQQIIKDAIREKLLGPAANLPLNITGQAVIDPKRTFDKYGASIPMAAAAMGGPAAPATAAAGEFLRQMIGTGLGSDEVPKTGLGRAGSVLLNASGTDEIAGPALAGAKKVLAPVGKVAGKFASRVGEVLTGVPERQFRRLAKDPGALLIPRTLKQAGERFGEALKKEGIDVTPTPDEVNDPSLAVARRTAKRFFEKLKNGIESPISIPKLKMTETPVPLPKDFNPIVAEGVPGSVSPGLMGSSRKAVLDTSAPEMKRTVDVVMENQRLPYQPDASSILKTKRATDRQIAGTSWKDKTGLRNLFDQKTKLNEMFENASGKGAEASKEYARSALAAQFRKVFPETQTGKMSFVKSVAMPLLARSALMPVVSSPLTAGLVTAGGAVGAKALAKLSQSELARLAIANSLAGGGK